jgi:hypothetical protein
MYLANGTVWPRACRFALTLQYRSHESEGGFVREESRTEQERDLNWNAILGMMALMLVSFGLYGAAVGTYFTLMS